jgi:excinuclease UvrABC ATPase subunit
MNLTKLKSIRTKLTKERMRLEKEYYSIPTTPGPCFECQGAGKIKTPTYDSFYEEDCVSCKGTGQRPEHRPSKQWYRDYKIVCGKRVIINEAIRKVREVRPTLNRIAKWKESK